MVIVVVLRCWGAHGSRIVPQGYLTDCEGVREGKAVGGGGVLQGEHEGGGPVPTHPAWMGVGSTLPPPSCFPEVPIDSVVRHWFYGPAFGGLIHHRQIIPLWFYDSPRVSPPKKQKSVNTKKTQQKQCSASWEGLPGRDVGEVQAWPAVFTCSLPLRMRPRYALAQLDGRHHLSLGSLFSRADAIFAATMGQPLPLYRAFLAQYLAAQPP